MVSVVKKGLTIVVAAAALAATLAFAAADSFRYEPVTDADALPAYEILSTLSMMGLNPISQPARRGPYYVLHAYDPRGIEVRVVADAQFGDILSIVPARALSVAYGPYYQRGPRIIHVPQPGDRSGRSSTKARGEPAVSHDGDGYAVVPLPRRRATPELADGPTPIRPIPPIKSKAEGGDKVDAPRDPDITSSTPPAAPPHSD